MTNIAIIGSRSMDNYELFVHEISKINMPKDKIRLISGGAKGVDTLAEKYADEMGYDKQIIHPEWDKYGKGAGIIRNKKIVREADMIIAFWDGKS